MILSLPCWTPQAPRNVVLDDEAHAVLTDFGLSKEGVDALYGTKRLGEKWWKMGMLYPFHQQKYM